MGDGEADGEFGVGAEIDRKRQRPRPRWRGRCTSSTGKLGKRGKGRHLTRLHERFGVRPVVLAVVQRLDGIA